MGPCLHSIAQCPLSKEPPKPFTTLTLHYSASTTPLASPQPIFTAFDPRFGALSPAKLWVHPFKRSSSATTPPSSHKHRQPARARAGQPCCRCISHYSPPALPVSHCPSSHQASCFCAHSTECRKHARSPGKHGQPNSRWRLSLGLGRFWRKGHHRAHEITHLATSTVA